MTFGLKAAADGLSGTLQVGGVDKATLDSNGKLTLTTIAAAVQGGINSAAAQASTSGTSIDFTGIPSWAKRVTLMLNGVSTNGTSNLIARVGDSGGFSSTGYLGVISNANGSVLTNYGTSFILASGVTAAGIHYGKLVLNNISGNDWNADSKVGQSGAGVINYGVGGKTLSAVLDRIRLTTENGTDTFDAGSVNILYE